MGRQSGWPSLEALYAASQAFDEARHLEAFNKYIHTRLGKLWPVNKHLKGLLDKILTDPRWDLKFLGMQVIIEGLALSAYTTAKQVIQDPVYTQMIDLILRDEARHVAFGITYFPCAFPPMEMCSPSLCTIFVRLRL